MVHYPKYVNTYFLLRGHLATSLGSPSQEMNNNIWLSSNSQTPFKCCPLKDPVHNFALTFNYHASLFFFNVSLAFITLTFFNISYFIEYSSIWVCMMFSWNKILDMHVWQKYHRNDSVFSLQPIQVAYNFDSSHYCGVHFDYLIRWCLPSFPTVKLLFCFPLVINTHCICM